jgi:hypothetical protein
MMSPANRLSIACTLAALVSPYASAHVSYSGRDYFANGSFDGVATYTLANQRVTSAFGWADGADPDLGDSHRVRFARFSLDAPADVTIRVWQQDDVGYTSGGQVMTALNDLVPAFSLYAGLLPGGAFEGGDHPDFRDPHPGYLPTSRYFYGRVGILEGGFNALGSFSMSNKESEVGTLAWRTGTLTYLGHAIDGNGIDVNGDRVLDLAGDGVSDGQVERMFRLGPGDYSLTIGGACYVCQFAESDATWLAQRGFSTSLTVQPVPEPQTWVLLAGGLLTLAWRARRP